MPMSIPCWKRCASSRANWIETDAAAGAEDRATLDFTGSVDGEEFEGGKASDFVLAMGQGRMIQALKKALWVTKQAKPSLST